MSPPGPFGLSQICDHLYVSNGRAAKDAALISRLQISCIINATEREEPRLPCVEYEYVHVPVSDSPDTRLENYFDAVADKIEAVRRRRGRVLLHCRAGVSRSAALCLAALMKNGALTLRQAHALLRARRPIARPNPGFWTQLIRYELKLRGSNSVKMISSPAGPVPDLYEIETRHFVPL